MMILSCLLTYLSSLGSLSLEGQPRHSADSRLSFISIISTYLVVMNLMILYYPCTSDAELFPLVLRNFCLTKKIKRTCFWHSDVHLHFPINANKSL